MFENIKKALKWFDKQDTYGQYLLIFAGVNIVAFIFGVIFKTLKDNNICDVTPVLDQVTTVFNWLALALFCISVVGIIYMIWVVGMKKVQSCDNNIDDGLKPN